MKVCGKCKIKKNKNEFSKHKNGLQSWCNNCRKEYYEKNKEKILKERKNYYQDNKEIILNKSKKYYKENKEKALEQKKKYYQNNKERILKKEKEYRKNNKEKIAIYKKNYQQKDSRKEYREKYYQNNKERILNNRKNYYQNNRDRLLENQKEYYHNNKEARVEYNKEYFRNNPHIGFNNRLKRKERLENVCGSGITKKEWYEIMNSTDWTCFYCEEYIGNKNRKRTLDHIIPVSRGGPNTKENLIPSCKRCNCSKNDKIGNEWKYFNSLPKEKQEHITKTIDKYGYSK